MRPFVFLILVNNLAPRTVNAQRRPPLKARAATWLSELTQNTQNEPRARGSALSAFESVPPSHLQWASKAWYRRVSRGGILGYPGVVSWGIRGYPGYPPSIRRIAVPKMTQITMAPVTRKGILGGRSKCYIILEGAQQHFGATWRTSTCSIVCTRATLVPSPPRPLHSILSHASF